MKKITVRAPRAAAEFVAGQLAEVDADEPRIAAMIEEGYLIVVEPEPVPPTQPAMVAKPAAAAAE